MGLLAVVTGMTVLAACGSEDDVLRRPDGQPISTSTTRIAEVNLVNPERNFTKTCSAPTAPDAGRPDVEAHRRHRSRTARRGLRTRWAPGHGCDQCSPTVPAYLGPQLQQVPAIGVSSADAASKARPRRRADYAVDGRFSSCFPGRARHEHRAGRLGGRIHRRRHCAAPLIGGRDAAARLPRRRRGDRQAVERGIHRTQVSLVRFGPDSETIAGTDSFAGQILGIVGVQRPQRQRQPAPSR